MEHPVYRNLCPYPNQSHHCSHLFYPGTEHIPNQMYMNPIQPPVNYGYVPPIPCLGCCNWGSSPCSHHIPHSHCFGNYHSFPPQCMPCFPNGGFEKNVPMTHGQHCCGCPNHSIVWKDNDNVDNNQVMWKDGAKNGLYPLDLVSTKKQTGGEEREEGEGRRFPFPICWMPCEPKGNGKEMEKQHLSELNAKPSLEPERSPRVTKIIEVKEVEKHKEDEGTKNQKTIEVKEVEKHKEDEGSKNQERGSDGEKKMDKGSKESVKRKNPSPPKLSKLPPVCLRVDPLPKRKAAKGSSQSPNPRSDKQKPGLPLDNILPNEVKEGNGTKTVEVVDGKTHQEENTGEKVEIRVDAKVESKARENIENDGMKGRSEEFGDAMGKNEEGTKETSKRSLSEEEAALIIQSAYRGFDTRRWDPVKKLKEIAEVRDQIDGVKHMIQAMELCSDIEGSSKQRNVISETIMSLLLKLDTIQGLHPIIREIRKTVVQELVSLQEKLVSTMIEKSENSPHEPNMSCEEDASNKIEDATKSKNGNENLSDLPEEADQNQPVGALNCLNLGYRVDNEVPMVCLEREDEKSSEGLESDKTSAKNDEGELVLEQTYKVPILPDSSIKVTDFAPSECGELESELTDHPEEEHIGTKSDMDSLNTGKEIDNPLKNEMSSQLLQEGVSEQDTAEETKTAEKEPKNNTTGYCAENHEAHEENASPDVRIDVQTEMEKGEDNSKLIEENEKLRGTVENLVKLGQEQMMAISSLTARVKNLERKSSKKEKKLKVKQRKGSKNKALLISDGYC